MGYEFKTEPFTHQRECLQESVRRREFAFLMDMGTGKTKLTIDEFCILYEAGRVDCVLVVPPKSVAKNWTRRELPKHMPERIWTPAHVCEWEPGTVRGREALARVCRPSPGRLRILVINVEAFQAGDKAVRAATAFLQSGQSYLAIDESPKIKHPDSNRAKNLIAMGRLAKYRRILTGTPITNSPLEAFSQFEFLRPGLLGFKNFWAFRAKYTIRRENKKMTQQMRAQGRKGKAEFVVGWRGLDDLQQRISEHSFRKTKGECMDLPPKLWGQLDVELTDEQASVYSQLANFFNAQLGEKQMTVSLAMTQIMRLQQVCCGYAQTDDGQFTKLASRRNEVLLEALEEDSCPKKIIWSKFANPVIPELVDLLRTSYGERSVAQFWGGVPDSQSETDQLRFMEDDSTQFIVASHAKGARGNTWHMGESVYYHNQSPDLEERLQSEDRSHRHGLRNAVTYTDIVATGTLEERLAPALRERFDIMSLVSGDQIREWLVYQS